MSVMCCSTSQNQKKFERPIAKKRKSRNNTESSTTTRSMQPSSVTSYPGNNDTNLGIYQQNEHFENSQILVKNNCNKIKFDAENKLINDYQIVNFISEGAYGQVFLVVNVVSGIRYAMKVQHKNQTKDKNCLKVVLNELAILRNMKECPFVVKMIDSFETQGKIFIVLEYMECGNLARALQMQPSGMLDEQLAKMYISEVVLAIQYLHSYNIVYRDLKPDNILIDSEGHLKLTDFGLSKQMLAEFDTSDTFCGSPAYMTPEMLASKPHNKTIDWYGVGALLYELVVSVPPYLNTSDKDKLY